jgi:hypothetical protein
MSGRRDGLALDGGAVPSPSDAPPRHLRYDRSFYL